MSDIVERLLRWGYSADLSTANDLMGEAAAEIARLRLTDAEREAVAWASRAADPDYTGHAATLRGLLERLGGDKC